MAIGVEHIPARAGEIPAECAYTALDAAVQTLQAAKERWVAVSVAERIALLDRLIGDFGDIAERWVEACCKAKSIPPDSPVAAEEWSLGPFPLIRTLTRLRQALRDIDSTGRPRIPGPITTRTDGQVTARVFPQTLADRLFFTGVTAEIWMEPGVTSATLAGTQAVAYHGQQHAGGVALVLGAGNVSCIGVVDTLYKLFVEDRVVLLKSNPVTAYLTPLVEAGFDALIAEGFVRVVNGGSGEGAYLCNHPGVDDIHMTGSDRTFDVIVFGGGREGAARKAAGKPLLDKRVTAELGNISPVIVVPGPWSAVDIAYQAQHLASTLAINAGFNCCATRMIVQHAGWTRREPLLDALRGHLAATPVRTASYPGSREIQQRFTEAHPEAEQIGTTHSGELPWTLIAGVDGAGEDICFTTEPFCGLCAETALEASSIPAYIDRAVEFANNRLWGTLTATIVVHPASLKDPTVAQAVERAIANLCYGTVGINYWAGATYGLAVTTWGGFPGHPLNDIQSGRGVVFNSLMFDRPQKTVVRGPFRAFPLPPWFVSQGRRGLQVFPRLVRYDAAPSPGKIPAILWAALRPA